MAKKTTSGNKQVSNNVLMAVFIVGFAIIGSILIFKSSAAPLKTGTITSPTGDLKFGGVVNFSATWSKSVKEARLYVECRNESNAILYGELINWNTSGPSATAGDQAVTLGGGWSEWHNDPEQPANCVAYLKDYVGAPRTKEVVDLAQVSFKALGQ